MSSSHDFLVEIGCEELPPNTLQTLGQCLANNIKASLQNAQLNFTTAQWFASPRRLAVRIHQLDEKQPEQLIERRGPAINAAFDNEGNPSKAALGFAASCKVAVNDLITLETAKGTWLAYKAKQPGESVQNLLPDLIEKAFKQLPIAKLMRWGNSDNEFVRPVHWLVMLYGEKILDASLFGLQASNQTYGHRFHHPESIRIQSPADYESSLKKAYVIADFNARKTVIEKQIAEQAATVNAGIIPDEALLNEVTALVEWPVALKASFDPAFLQIPNEALVAAMRDHQKSFALSDKEGNLLAHFISIANIVSKQPERVIDGNEKVMRARLSDAAFFYHTDAKASLASHIDASKQVVFQNKLGSLFDKTERLTRLCQFIAEKLKYASGNSQRAAQLSKCDLLTNMVNEFPELQGIMGYYYALADNELIDVAIAIKEHYLPRFAGDDLPSTNDGIILSMAERLDTLVGVFGINKQPSGEKDPFKCRRAAIGVIRLLVEKSLNLKVTDLLSAAFSSYTQPLENKDTCAQVHAYLLERLKTWYQEQNISANTVAAVLACQNNHLADLHQRILAVNAFTKLNEANALAAANKRVSRILAKENYSELNSDINKVLLQDDAEIALAQCIEEKKQILIPLYQKKRYKELLTELSSLREPVDQFFDRVMVNVEDEKLRQNRLTLLADLRRLFLKVADISLLQ